MQIYPSNHIDLNHLFSKPKDLRRDERSKKRQTDDRSQTHCFLASPGALRVSRPSRPRGCLFCISWPAPEMARAFSPGDLLKITGFDGFPKSESRGGDAVIFNRPPYARFPVEKTHFSFGNENPVRSRQKIRSARVTNTTPLFSLESSREEPATGM